MEDEFYKLVVKGNDLKTYARRFQELATLCPNMVPNNEKLIEVFIGGLPISIEGNVTASKPQTLEKAITITQRLMDHETKHNAMQVTNDHKRKFDYRRNTNNDNNYPNNRKNNNYPSDRNNNNYQNNRNNNNNNHYPQQQNRRQETVRAYPTTPTKNKSCLQKFIVIESPTPYWELSDSKSILALGFNSLKETYIVVTIENNTITVWNNSRSELESSRFHEDIVYSSEFTIENARGHDRHKQAASQGGKDIKYHEACNDDDTSKGKAMQAMLPWYKPPDPDDEMNQARQQSSSTANMYVLDGEVLEDFYRFRLDLYEKRKQAVAGISHISFGEEETVSPRKSISEAKQRELSGTLDSESETRLKKQISDAKNRELSGHNIFAPPPEFNLAHWLLGEECVIKTAKKIPDKKLSELSGNNIFKGDEDPSSVEKPLSSAKLREMSGSNIFADGEVDSRDYLGARKPHGGDSSIALV
ncbi:DNA oxidative demethylase [Tanacetum coccineum]